MARWRTMDMLCPVCEEKHDRLVDLNSEEPEICGKEHLDPEAIALVTCKGVLQPLPGAPAKIHHVTTSDGR